MAAPVTALQPLQLPPGPSPVTPEQRYWRTFRSQLLISSPQSSPVTHISVPSFLHVNVAAATPETFAVTSGNRVQIYSSRTRKLIKTISRFGVNDVAHSGDIRPDGRVLVAAGSTGTIQVFDVSSRAILKTWKEHKQPVWTTKWNPADLTHLMSASDDRTLRLWDLPSQESVGTFVGHQDYVRSGAFMPGWNSNLLVSGSYDQTVRLWDQRASERAVMIFKHVAAIESVLPMPSGMTLLASAHNAISVLDLTAAKSVHVLKSHQKTVTCMCIASNGARLLAGGLDGHVKVFETVGWTVVAGSKYPSPILAMNVVAFGAGKEDRHIAVGMQSGLLSIRTRLSGQQKLQENERQQEMQALVDGRVEEHDKKFAKKRMRGLAKRDKGLQHENVAAIVIDGNVRGRRAKIPNWDRALRKGLYAQALNLVLGEGQPSPPTVLTLLTALRDRSALKAALNNRDEVTLKPILEWLIKHISNPRHVLLIARVSMLVLELHAEHLGRSFHIDRLIERLHSKVRSQVDNSQTACSTQGMLELIVAKG